MDETSAGAASAAAPQGNQAALSPLQVQAIVAALKTMGQGGAQPPVMTPTAASRSTYVAPTGLVNTMGGR